MANKRINRVNTLGIPTIESIKATLTTTALTFTFNNHPQVSDYFQGLFIVKISGTPTPPSGATAVAVYFDTDGLPGSAVAVCNSTGAGLTSSDFPGDGVYLMFYDRTTNVLRMINTII